MNPAIEMNQVYEHFHTVGEEEIDILGHANNVMYVEWMQAAAVAHSAALGWPGERYRRLGIGWVVRSHQIEYRQPAYAGQQIVVRTWVAEMKKVTSLRRYQIVRLSDEAILAEAQTNWAFISYSTGQPFRIPVEIAAAFPVKGDAEGE
jgi:acyl-CoA thioester hydrolase